MNNGAFGENFPYSNFHDLNMDWIIKIAKDFLDQYSQIQTTLDNGLEALDAKATELEGLLQEWYDTHSQDIADQLADALSDLNDWYTQHEGFLDQYVTSAIASFNHSAEEKAAETIATIPSDYTFLSNTVKNITPINWLNAEQCLADTSYNENTGATTSIQNWFLTPFIEVPRTASTITSLNYVVTGGQTYKLDSVWIAQYDESKNYIGQIVSNPSAPNGFETVNLNRNARFVRVTTYKSQLFDNAIYFNDNTQDAVYNFFPVTKLNIGGVVNDDGTILSHDSFGYTDYIEVPKWARAVITNNTVTVGGSDQALELFQFAEYDANKNFIRNVKGNSALGYVITPIDIDTVKYIRVDFGKKNIPDGAVIFIGADYNTKWYGKTGDFLGDSLTEQDRYTSSLTTLFNIKINNYGISGTGFTNVLARPFLNRITGMSEDCDFVFILGGTNDWAFQAPLGNPGDVSMSTFYGALYSTFETLRAKFPTKPMFISTITQRNWTQDNTQPSGIDNNGNGNSIKQFNDAIKYMAARYDIVVLDGFAESGICIANIATYTSDGLHFNTAGGKRFAQFINDGMNKVTPY